MRRNVLSSLLLLTAAVPLCASGCGRLAPAGPPADREEGGEVERIVRLFPEDDGGDRKKDEVEATEATGLATIKGVLRLAGDDLPTVRLLIAAVLKVPADVPVCMPGGRDVPSKALVIGKNRGIANTLIYLKTKNNAIGWTNIPKPPEVQDIDPDDPANVIPFDQKACVFLGHVVAARVGQKLNARNLDDAAHNINGIAGVLIPGKGSTLITLEKKAAAPIAAGCNIHPWMSAWVLPYDNGYFAVTDADGNFEIKNLPAGVELEFNVWHESAVSATQRLNFDVTRAEIADFAWTQKQRGRFKITLQPGQTADFKTIEVPLAAFKQ
jgi:hypothetical protein